MVHEPLSTPAREVKPLNPEAEEIIPIGRRRQSDIALDQIRSSGCLPASAGFTVDGAMTDRPGRRTDHG